MNRVKYSALASAACAALLLGLPQPAFASSHREAPLITETPKLDGTDFYLFRSYEAGRGNFVTAVADYIPLQDGYGGPNFFTMDPDAYYDINIDNTGSGVPDIIFRFNFKKTDRNLALNIGGATVAVPLVDIGPISTAADSNQNVIETYTVTMLRRTPSGFVQSALTDAQGGRVFPKPIDNIGMKTIADYASYAAGFIRTVNIPGCGTGRLFAGQRKDPFVVNLGQTFDLVNYKHPVGEQYNNAAHDDLADKNVTALEIEVPASCLVNKNDPVIGGWTTSSKNARLPDGSVQLRQYSRLGNPLVNELVIGLPDKDTFNASLPKNDGQFATYVTNPTVPTIVESLFSAAGVKAPTQFPRQDLVAVFLTGLKIGDFNLNQPARLVRASEEMRLNTSIPVTGAAQQSRLGVIGGDNAGYPNGRRPGDDVVDITLRVAMGRLYTLGLFGGASNAPSGGLDFTDGALVDSSFFDTAFPYLRTPIPGSPGVDAQN